MPRDNKTKRLLRRQTSNVLIGDFSQRFKQRQPLVAQNA
jgi:hypothetical protein